MLKRIITSVVAFPILAAFIVYGGFPLKAAIFTIIVVGMYEVYGALSGKNISIHYVGFIFAGVYMLYADNLRNTNVMTIILISLTLSVLALLVLFHKRVTVVDCAVTLFGFFYVTVLMSSVYLVRMSAHGSSLVWLIFITAWGSDTGAYCVGRLIGKHKLTWSPSPGKTVEGVIGGIATAAALSVIYGLFIGKFFTNDDPLRTLIFAVVGIMGGIFSIFGDLTASAIKRYANIKDFGSILPGHGGIIDRFDSVLFTAPAVFVVILLMVK